MSLTGSAPVSGSYDGRKKENCFDLNGKDHLSPACAGFLMSLASVHVYAA